MRRADTSPGMTGPLKPVVLLWVLTVFGLVLAGQVAVRCFLAEGRAEVTQRDRVVEAR